MTGLDALEARAEVLKLARVLGESPERLGFLESVPPGDVRALREQATDVLFEGGIGVLRRMAVASRLLPAAPLAKIAEKAFGPLLCARIAGLVDPERAVDIAARLPAPFLADVAAELDPRRARDVLAGIPTGTVGEVARELVRREDWITIGRFVGNVPEPAVRASLDVLDDAALLRVAFVLDDKSRAGDVLGLLPKSRYAGLLRAADEHGLWAEAFAVALRADAPLRDRLAEAASTLGPGTRANALGEARALGLDQQGTFATLFP